MIRQLFSWIRHILRMLVRGNQTTICVKHGIIKEEFLEHMVMCGEIATFSRWEKKKAKEYLSKNAPEATLNTEESEEFNAWRKACADAMEDLEND